MSITTPELVLLDLDGTLVDSIPDLVHCLNLALADMRLPRCGLDSARNWVGDGVDKLIRHALTDVINDKVTAKQCAQAKTLFMDYYRAGPCKLSNCYPGVREGLDMLQGRGMKMGVVTNKNAEFAIPILETLGIREHMNIVIGGDTLTERKPHPLPLLHAAAVFNKPPSTALIVGDSVNDVKAARAAGFQVVCVSYGYNHGDDIRDAGPDAVIDSLTELPALFA